MLRTTLSAFALAVVGVAAWGASTVHAPSHDAARSPLRMNQPVVAPTATGLAPSTTALLLTLSIDANGVEVVTATPKPALRYRPARITAPTQMTWRLLDGDDEEIAQGGFDPGPLDLTPGARERVRGDRVMQTHTALNIKVPDVPFARIEFAHRTADGALRTLNAVANHHIVRR